MIEGGLATHHTPTNGTEFDSVVNTVKPDYIVYDSFIMVFHLLHIPYEELTSFCFLSTLLKCIGRTGTFSIFSFYSISNCHSLQFGWKAYRAVPEAVSVLDTQDLHFLRRSRQKALAEGIFFRK